MNKQMIPADFIFNYKTTEYNDVENFLSSHGLSATDIHLLFALFGSNNANKIPLETTDGSNQRSISIRTIYPRKSPEMERDYGLITIVNNLNIPYRELLNNKAFLKNNNGEKFYDLPNVSEFYQSLLGGIESLNNLIFQYSRSEESIFESLYDYLTDDENVKLIQGISDKANKE